jgi:hypothetical protein
MAVGRFFATWMVLSLVLAFAVHTANQSLFAIPQQRICPSLSNSGCPSCAIPPGTNFGCHMNIPLDSFIICESATSGDCNNVLQWTCHGKVNSQTDCSGVDLMFTCDINRNYCGL